MNSNSYAGFFDVLSTAGSKLASGAQTVGAFGAQAAGKTVKATSSFWQGLSPEAQAALIQSGVQVLTQGGQAMTGPAPMPYIPPKKPFPVVPAMVLGIGAIALLAILLKD